MEDATRSEGFPDAEGFHMLEDMDGERGHYHRLEDDEEGAHVRE